MKELIKGEFYKFFHSKVMILSFLSIPLLIGLLCNYFLKNNIVISNTKENIPKFASNISLPYLIIYKEFMVIMSILVIFYVSIFITEELKSGAIRMQSTRGYSLWNIVFSKAIIISLIIFIDFVVCFILSKIIGSLFFNKVEFAYTFLNYKKIKGTSAFLYTLKFYGLSYLIIMAMVTFMTFISVISKNKLVTISIGLAIVIMDIFYTDIVQKLAFLGKIKFETFQYITINQLQVTGVPSFIANVNNSRKIILGVLSTYFIIFSLLTLIYTKKYDYVD